MDSELPKPPETVHIMLEFAMPWSRPSRGPRDVHFQGYPDEAIIDWHQRHQL